MDSWDLADNIEYRFSIVAEIKLSDEFTYDHARDMIWQITHANRGVVKTCSPTHNDCADFVDPTIVPADATFEITHAWIDLGFATKHRQEQAKKMLRRRARGKPRFEFSHGPEMVTFKATPDGGYVEERFNQYDRF